MVLVLLLEASQPSDRLCLEDIGDGHYLYAFLLDQGARALKYGEWPLRPKFQHIYMEGSSSSH